MGGASIIASGFCELLQRLDVTGESWPLIIAMQPPPVSTAHRARLIDVT